MSQSNNAAAEQIVRAQSIIKDLTTQMGELQNAISSQTDLVAMLSPIAIWEESAIEPEVPVEGEGEEPNGN